MELVLNKMCTACYALRKIKHIVLIDTLRVIYFTLIRSIISYGIIFGGSSSGKWEGVETGWSWLRIGTDGGHLSIR